jgi:hypothetical protein
MYGRWNCGLLWLMMMHTKNDTDHAVVIPMELDGASSPVLNHRTGSSPSFSARSIDRRRRRRPLFNGFQLLYIQTKSFFSFHQSKYSTVTSLSIFFASLVASMTVLLS